MLSRMIMVFKAVGHTFHKWFALLPMFIGFLLLYVIVSIGMILDYVFFPSLWKKRVKNPVVIVGNPRTGTTFLQRFLVQNGLGSGMRIWKMLYPSLVLQTLLKPFLPLLEKMSPARFHEAAAHKTSLTGIETDDPSLLFRYFDGFFVYGFFLAWSEDDPKEMFDPDIRDTSKRDFSWLRKIWRRNLISEKRDRVIGKLFSLGVRIPRFLNEFPDAKILYMVRDPLSTVPSGLSLVTGVLDGRFGFWNLPEETRQKYIDRLYDAFLELSMKFYNDYVSGKIPKDKVKVVTFPRLMQNFDNLMNEIMDFIGEKPSSELQKTIQETAEKQRNYKSKHKYSLEKFGLDEEKIRQDYAPIYETFLS